MTDSSKLSRAAKAPKAGHKAGGKTDPGDQLRANLKKRKAQLNSRAKARATNKASNKADGKAERIKGT